MAHRQNGQLVSRRDFLGQGEWAREYYEGLLVVNHGTLGYDLGIELDHDQILKVDRASADEVKERVQYWGARIEEIRREQGARNVLEGNDLL